MQLTETLRNDPYNFTADVEYYDKGYREIVGVPGRVLQAKELTALSMYPIFAMADMADEIFEEGIIQGLGVSNDSKLDTGAVFGLSIDNSESLEDFKIYEIDDSGNEKEIEVDLSELDDDDDSTSDSDDSENPEVTEENSEREYSVKVYEHTGEDGWPLTIL